MLDLLKVFTEEDVSEFHYARENGEWTYVLK